jgi:hypothetical protein
MHRHWLRCAYASKCPVRSLGLEGGDDRSHLPAGCVRDHAVMRFARRSRARTEFLEAVQAELTSTRDELRAGVEALETELRDACEQLHDSMGAVLGHVDRREATMVACQTELLAAVERSTQTWQMLYTNGLEQHQAFLEAVERLNTMLSHPPSQLQADRSTVVGGTIDPGGIDAAGQPSVAANRSEAARPELLLHGVEVRCRFSDNRWVSGFEICDVFDQEGTLRYRLRRQSDGYILPTLFDDSSVRENSSSLQP